MAKTYYLVFGSGNPSSYSGLSPTFTIFSTAGVTPIAAPGITETPVGSGLYSFVYGPTTSIVFVADGGAALNVNDRFIKAALDPIQSVDESVGMSSDSVGSTGTDPTTIYGQIKRMQEYNEGDMTFIKATGTWEISTRGGTLIASKTLTNTTTSATRS